MSKRKTHRENELIFLTARTKMDKYSHHKIKELLINPLEWKKIIETSNQHQILPFLYYNLNKLTLLNDIPQYAFSLLKNSYYSNIVRNTKFWQEFDSTLKSINDAGIEIILLKGIIFMDILYHNLGLRIMSDIDILVKKNEIPESTNILLYLGYQEKTKYASLTHYQKQKYQVDLFFTKKIPGNQTLLLEIHTTPVPPRPHKISLPHLWARTQKKNLRGQNVTFLSWEDTFITLSLHLRRHTRDLYLKFVIDIAELLNQYSSCLDWEYIVKEVKRNHIISSTYFALYISKELLDVPLSANILKPFRLSWLRKKLLYFCMNKYNFLTPKVWQGYILRLLLFDKTTDLFLYFWRVIFFERFIAKQVLSKIPNKHPNINSDVITKK